MKLDHSKPNPFDKNYEEIELEDEETGLTTGEMVLESTTLPFTTKHQLCTDFPFLVLFSAFLIILSILYASIHSSRWSTQPKSLLYPTDFLGRSCGSINKQQYALAKKSDTLESVNTLSVPYFGACKESVYSLQCQTEVLRYFRSFTNEVEFYDLRTKPYLYYLDTQDPGKYGGICVSYCPGTKENENYCPPELKQYNGTNACSFKRPDGTLFVEAAESMQFRTILNRCIPTTASLKAAHFAPSARVIDKYAAMMPEVFSESIAHVVRQWKIVLLSLVTALLLAFVFLIVIRLFARLFIWLIVFSVMIGMVIGVVFAAGEALQWRQKYFPTAIAEAQFYRYSTSFSAQTYGVIAVALGSCLIMYTLFVYVYYSNIQRSVGIMREAARAVSSVPQLMLFCVGMFFILLVFYMQWFLFSVNLWSIGSTTVVGENTVFNFSKYMRYASAIHLFGFFWLSQFITAYSITTTAGVVCEWYFTPKSKRPLLFLTMPVIRSAVSVTIYSLGSIAFGSLVVGIVKFISFVLRRVIQRLQSSVKKYRALNIIVGCFACIVRIFLAILNKIVNTITKHAYIQVAIYGTDFIESSRNAISLLTNNAAQVLVLDWVVDWILFCGKICIASATCYSSYLLSFVVPSSSGHIEGTSNFSLVLLALIFFCSYRIASLFLSLYDTATDTIIHCYLIDEQLCNANPSRAMSCSSELLGLMEFEREKNQDSIKMNGEY